MEKNKKEKVEKDLKKEKVEKNKIKKEKVEKRENKNTVLFVVLGIVLFFGASFLISKYLPENELDDKKSEGEYSVDNWYNETLSNNYVVTVLAGSTCPYCKKYKPIIEKLSEKYGFSLYFFNTDLLNEDDYMKLTTTYDFNSEYIPYTVIIKKKEVVADMVGFSSEEETIKFLKDNKVIVLAD